MPQLQGYPNFSCVALFSELQPEGTSSQKGHTLPRPSNLRVHVTDEEKKIEGQITNFAQDKYKWKAFVNTVMNLPVP
jgi:hypothetical protein